jgi:hypothetical protein
MGKTTRLALLATLALLLTVTALYANDCNTYQWGRCAELCQGAYGVGVQSCWVEPGKGTHCGCGSGPSDDGCILDGCGCDYGT